MKKIKLFLGFIVLVFASLVIYQNRDYFFHKQALHFSLGVETWNWTAPSIQNIVYYAIFLVLGLLVAGFFGLTSKLKSKKTIKALNLTIESQLEKIASLKDELDTFKNDPYIRQDKKDEVESVEIKTAEQDATA